MKKILLTISTAILLFISTSLQAQVDYMNPKKYTIADITVSGIEFLSKDALIVLSGLQIGQEITIPGDEISNAINKLWKQGFFSDVKISIVKTQGKYVYLNIYLQEQPRLHQVFFYGINSSQESDLKEKLNLSAGKQVTDNVLRTSEIIIKKYYADKGFPFVDINFQIKNDTAFQNTVNLYISIDKRNKVKINEIVVRGNEEFSDKKIKRILKDTKQKNFFRFWKTSKFIEEKFHDDKKRLIEKYNNAGYRDARILEDSVYVVDSSGEKLLNVYLKIFEGNKYYFRNIEWVGNTKFTTKQLNRILDIHKGEPYNQKRLEERLYTDNDAVGNFYYNDGYLFFQATPQEMNISNDSVDIRIAIIEGPQATINNIKISGNTRTNDYVIRRELKTLPGELFSKDDLVRSVRELANLGNFDPEHLSPTPIPNQTDGTVDIKYDVSERPTDMFELSGGWGFYGFSAQVGIKFNNFAMKNLFRPKYWDPLPMGDGQKFSISARVAGLRYQLYSISFVNPWFGGKKPNSLSASIYYNRMTNATFKDMIPTAHFNVLGSAIGFGKRLKWPDDYFILSEQLAYDKYIMHNNYNYINVGNGSYNIISLTTTISRNSIDNPLYTRRGSNLSLSVKATPPYSLFLKNTYSLTSDSLKFKWAELYKVTIKGDWYNEIVKNLVIRTSFEYGFLGYYNKDIGYTPFEGYKMGGKPMTYMTFGVDYVNLRGYKDLSITGDNTANLYSRYIVELRYPVLLKDMATLYVLGFTEGGNAWNNLYEFSPFNLYRSAGVGARLFIPMLGLVGIDAAYGFDPIPGNPEANGWNYHFTFGQQF